MKYVTRLWGLKVLLCLGIVTFLCRDTWAQSPSDILAQIHSRQQHYAQAIHSVRSQITTTTDYTPWHHFYENGPMASQPLHSERVVDYASKTDLTHNVTKIYNRQTFTDASGQLITVTNIWDGQKTYSFIRQSRSDEKPYGSSGAHLGGGLEVNPLELGYQYHAYPISQLISGNNVVVEGVVKDPTFGPLWIVRTPFKHGGQTGTYRFWFAPKYGMIAVKSEETDQLASNRTSQFSVSADQVTRHGGLWLAESGMVQHFIFSDGNGGLESTERLRFENTMLNSVSDALFRPEVPVGTHIDDVDTKQRYTLTNTHQWVRVKSPFDMLSPSIRKFPAMQIDPFLLLFCISAAATIVLLIIRKRTRRRSAA